MPVALRFLGHPDFMIADWAELLPHARVKKMSARIIAGVREIDRARDLRRRVQAEASHTDQLGGLGRAAPAARGASCYARSERRFRSASFAKVCGEPPPSTKDTSWLCVWTSSFAKTRLR